MKVPRVHFEGSSMNREYDVRLAQPLGVHQLLTEPLLTVRPGETVSAESG